MLLFEVSQMFDKALRDFYPLKPQVGEWLVKHERKHICLNHLCREIVLAEKQHKTRFGRPQLQKMVDGVAKMFAGNALKKKEEELLTEAERERQRKLLNPQSPEEFVAEMADQGVVIEEVESRNPGTGAGDSKAQGTGLHGLGHPKPTKIFVP